jgi:hypothetical protein
LVYSKRFQVGQTPDLMLTFRDINVLNSIAVASFRKLPIILYD